MKTFIVQASIPDKIYMTRSILQMESKPDDLIYWNERELNKFFPGRIWKRFDTNFGVIALQYLTPHLVRLIVRSTDENTAEKLLSSYLWQVKPKHPRRKIAFNPNDSN